MKKVFLAFIVSCCAYAHTISAQTPFLTMDSLDINRIVASVRVHGDIWNTGIDTSKHACQFPKGTLKNIGAGGSLWMSGYDDAGQLHIAAQTYRQEGNDYWPGPLDANDTLPYSTSYNWAKIWKVSRKDIQYFNSLTTHTTSNTPNAILTWPAKGNADAKGNDGNALVITDDMAPFTDLNSNGIYEPLQGEYPDIRGDQALWWAFSDNGATHSQTKSRPLGIEVHAMSYAYRRGSLIDNVVYYDYQIINRSGNNYNNFRSAVWSDLDLGYAFDDFTGFDSVHRMGIIYNGISDDGKSAGFPANSFGTNPPMAGVTIIEMPGDVAGAIVPAGSFTYYNNDASIIGNPLVDTEFNHYIRGKLRNGEPYKRYPPGLYTNYYYTSDPDDKAGWSECAANNNPGDRRFLISTSDLTLPAGSSQHIVMALVVADSTGGCPKGKFDNIKIVADTAWAIYKNPPPPRQVAVSSKMTNHNVTLYPNPANDKLFVEYSDGMTGDGQITVQNIIGQVMSITSQRANGVTTVDISKLPAGFYTLLYRNDNKQAVTRFVKE